ncbi:ATP-binding protein (plasmid) [Serratia marcescens]|uniref:ATP-binding protein n=1 Tax=Serratia TaxID=613 RepID=UPI00257003E4|nr:MULTISPECIES: ATP-binding protein [Serratia]MDM1819048.1 ATP-binding protein [Serratia ureilytica]WJD90528.1 ATP-binding protein [Serratia marcescens]
MNNDVTETAGSAPETGTLPLRQNNDTHTSRVSGIEARLSGLGPWLEYVDLVLQGLLLWQQQNEDDRLNMAGLILSPDEQEIARQALSGLPGWIRQPVIAPWLEDLQVPPVEGRLAEVVARFGLTPFETKVLVLGCLPLFDVRYELLLAYLQGEDKLRWPGIDLALTLFSASQAERLENRLTLNARHGALLREALVDTVDANGRRTDGLSVTYLRLNAIVFHFLNGEPADSWHAGLGEVCDWAAPDQSVSLSEGAWALTAEQLRRTCLAPQASRLVLLQGGPGRAGLMKQLASEAGRPLLTMDLSLLPEDAVDAGQILRTALCAVRLYAGVLLVQGWADGEAKHPEQLNALTSHVRHHGQPIVCLVTQEDAGKVWPGIPRLSIVLPPRSTRDDERLLLAGMASETGAEDWDWTGLLRRTRIDPDGVTQTWQEMEGYRLLRDPEAPLAECDLQQALRIRGQQQFGELAERVHPRRTFDDLIVSPELTVALREILAAIRQREAVLERGFARKVGYGTGISTLFYGPPGTGKTMAAEVLAGELGLDLIRVDLSSVVNKYVGETEKNLSKIFDLAVADTAVLLFDEADALFGKRSEVKDAHDRHANIQVSYLLQRLEQYPGLVVLTTNNRGHLDDAFTRRLTFITRFEEPDVTLRERMWRSIWPSDILVDDCVDWAQWAAATDLTGAGIRNVALLASWLAAEAQREVTQADIERAVRLELAKMGRFMLPLSDA